MPTQTHPPEVNRSAEPATPRPFIPGNNTVEADHGRLKARLRPMRGLKIIRSLRTIAAGHAFVQNLRRGHDALTADLPVHDRIRAAFTELALDL
jgi:transposase-like protein